MLGSRSLNRSLHRPRRPRSPRGRTGRQGPDGDLIEIIVDRNNLTGSINLIGDGTRRFTPEEGAKVLASRSPSVPLHADPQLPADTLLWAVLQKAGGGTWGGCVYDPQAIAKVMEAGFAALAVR